MKRRLVVMACSVVLAALAVLPVSAACRIYNGKLGNYGTVVLENDIIKVSLMPDSNGRIAEYIFKPDGSNQIPSLALNEFSVTDDLRLVRSNYAGYEDWIWELGLSRFQNTSRRYASTIVENTPEACAVTLTVDGAYRIDRTIRIKDGSSLVDVTTRLTNRVAEQKTYSYWAHTMVEPGNAESLRDLAVYSSLGRSQGKLHGMEAVKSEGDAIFSKVFAKTSGGNIVLQPRQDWWGVVNRKDETALIQLVPQADLGSDGACYCYSDSGEGGFGGDFAISMEVIYASRVFKSGEGMDYRSTFAVCKGVKGISYASRSVCLDADILKAALSGKKLTVPVRISSPETYSDTVSGRALLLSGGREVSSAKLALPYLSPKASVPLKLVFDNVQPGEYRLHFVFAGAKGEKLAEFDVLEPVKVSEVAK